MNRVTRVVAQLIFFSLALLASFSVLAAETNVSARLLKVTAALGLPVKNLQQERIGHVDDIVFDLHSGRIKYVLLATAGFWDRERSEDVAVPATALRMSSNEDVFLIDADKRLLSSRTDQSPPSRAVIRDAAGAKNEEPAEQESIPPTKSANEVIAHARQLLGGTLSQKTGEKMGKIRDAAIDFQRNELVYVVVASGGFLGFGETLFGVPSRGVTLLSANEFSIDAEGVAARTASFDKEHWPQQLKRSAHSEYAFYGQNINEPSGNEGRKSLHVTSEDQSNSAGDLQITRLIRKAIVNDASFSVAAQNITVVTRGRTVTLVGEVDDQREKEALVKVAKQIAGDAVDDRLKVRR
ncbi:MAG: antigen [Verrucomicrobiales bacterium]|nr:antigen [Verrucomicrobiales bacterium]